MQPTSPAPLGFAPLRSINLTAALGLTLALSTSVCGFLVWLVYFKGGAEHQSAVIASLPLVNAVLNSFTAAFLVSGYVAIRRGNWRLHMRWMFAALAASSLFFVSYVVYHNFQGDTKFTTPGAVRYVYFTVLVSHIVLSAVVVPLILLSFFLALSGRMKAHRKLSRYTFPIWLYVSVTGVLVFVMLKVFNS
jgi:putative membrane protein